uniref:Probable mediator of RNA polymerase II transcription subunit 37b n=1 Tax=Diabrotica virgifera virgifera TaxID=50390 RepID=A0A6P7H5C2_DIAVI
MHLTIHTGPQIYQDTTPKHNQLKVNNKYSHITHSKHIIGRKFDECFIQEYISREFVQYQLEKGLHDKALFKINVNNESTLKTPEEVSAEILKHLKEMAEYFLGRKVFKV